MVRRRVRQCKAEGIGVKVRVEDILHPFFQHVVERFRQLERRVNPGAGGSSVYIQVKR